jgi:hypothetical protein
MQLRQPLDSQVPRRLLVEQWRIVLNELADLHVLRDSYASERRLDAAEAPQTMLLDQSAELAECSVMPAPY